jgi:ribosome assembly protein YihI (activator of Der GTPase)
VRYYQSWIEKVDNIDQLCSELGIEDSEQIDEIKAEYDRFGKSEDILFCDENDESE